MVIPKGLWTFETYGSYASQPSSSREQIYSGTIGAGYYFIPNNSLNLELTGVQVTQEGSNALSGAADLLLRTHLINEPQWSLFIDFGAGILESSSRVPESGTNFNFFFKTGVGAAIHLWDKTDLLVGTRYEHISNARLDGPEHNPSINAIEAYVGLLFKF